MTFSVVARCDRTGQLGIGIATHAYAVGARCPFARAGVGAVVTQATTDPRLGPFALSLLELGYSAEAVIAQISTSDRHRGHHQLGVVDRDGNAAGSTGEANKAWAGHYTGRNFAVLGNNLIAVATAEGMKVAFERTEGLDLDERLLRVIEAGRDAGGQHGGQRSAALLLYGQEQFPLVDLRVDAHSEPILELRRVFDLYRPLRDYFTERVSRPDMRKPPDA